MPRDPKKKFLALATRAAELVILIPLAFWGLIQLIEAITSRKQISSFLTEVNIHLHETISSLTIGIAGVTLAVIAALVIGYEARGERVRHKRTRPAAVVMVAGIALALSATLYATKAGNLVNTFRASVSPAQALTKAPSVKVDHKPSTGTSQTIAEESQQPLFSGEEATASTTPTTYCGCPSSAGRETWTNEEWGEPERTEEEWGEPEEEWEEEEEWEGEPEEEWEEEEW